MHPLIVKNLTKIFKSQKWPLISPVHSFVAVNNISFTLKKGEILGFLGPNGAGKTTTIQMLLGVLNPTAGEIYYFGQDFSKNRSSILKKVTFASSYIKLPSKLTVWENLDVAGRLYSVPNPHRSERITSLLKFFDMWHLRDKMSGELSAGQITRVMLAKAFLPNPDIILLDEPTASLDPDVAQEVREFIVQQKTAFGISILFTSHNMDEVTQVCDRVLVLKEGNIIADDTPAALAATISKAHVHLVIEHGLDLALAYVHKENIPYKQMMHQFSFEIDESKIGRTLIALANAGVIFTNISVDKPSLHDYFLTVAKTTKERN